MPKRGAAGARAITGPYLAILGASTMVVCVVSGLGELLGYALRLGSGYLSDRTGRYWAITIIGYAVNLFAVPPRARPDAGAVGFRTAGLRRLSRCNKLPPPDTRTARP